MSICSRVGRGGVILGRCMQKNQCMHQIFRYIIFAKPLASSFPFKKSTSSFFKNTQYLFIYLAELCTRINICHIHKYMSFSCLKVILTDQRSSIYDMQQAMQSDPNGHLPNVAILLYYINPERLQALKKEIIQKFDRQKSDIQRKSWKSAFMVF